ncbi:DUF4160 domain-containing protein [Spirosoma arcticum]
MPKLAVYGNLVFYIFAYDLIERMHVHVSNTKSRSGKPAKIWLDTLEVFEQGNLTNKEISTALKLLATNKELLEKSILHFAAEGKTKTLNLR